MANVKAQAAKDHGNTAFKAGDYPTAIGHYTAAILADRKDATFPLNRAAAYLKLGKYEDAERDCTNVLGLNPKNVKGLFRRGQARLGLGKLVEAQRDFTDALLIEPSNSSSQEELKKVTSLIQEQKAKKSKAPISPMQATLDPNAAPRRRRVPITIVEPPPQAGSSKLAQAESGKTAKKPQDATKSIPQPPKAFTDTLEAVSSRSLKPPPSSTPTTSPIVEATSPNASSSASTSPPTSYSSSETSSAKPASFMDAKQARENAKPSRVGGGIFRASGKNTIFPTRDSTTLADTPVPPPAAVPRPILTPVNQKNSPPQTASTYALNGSIHKPPSSLFDFTRVWGSLKSIEEKWQYLNTVPPSALPTFCKTSLEPSLLVSILATFLAALNAAGEDPGIKQRVNEYLDNFAKVPRFGTLVLFLSKDEKMLAKQVLSLVGLEKPTGVWAPVA
ncbi:unnamed protein product [Cyclocybe aegerita]|uniref:RNA polymerase II-associated protein 3 n=1 Tax=Cyclocybe aegerita TaxID=1973307 RepID=A0A8S0VTU9_CYCAE|nr:unnamed protein product [Cyclocybe aegerita]